MLSLNNCRAGVYSHESIIAFEKFVKEFKDYFAPTEFDSLLVFLSSSIEAANHTNCIAVKEAIEAFQLSKANFHKAPLNSIKDLFALRKLLIELRNTSEDPSIYVYAWDTDLRLENLLYVILGSFLSSAFTPLRNDEELDSFLHLILYGLRNLGLSGYENHECSCVEDGLLLFISMTSNATLYYLRLMAMLNRAERMIKTILCDAFPPCHFTV